MVVSDRGRLRRKGVGVRADGVNGTRSDECVVQRTLVIVGSQVVVVIALLVLWSILRSRRSGA